MKNVISTVRLLLLASLIAVSGCGGGNGGASSGSGTPLPDSNTESATIPAAGGVIEVASTSSPITGARVVIATDTLLATETFTISYQDSLPGPFNSASLALGAKAISKVLILTRTGTIDFGKSVNVTMPFDRSQLLGSAIPVVLYWDEVTNSYSPIAIKSLDRTNGQITFLTAHASKYVVAVIDRLAGVTAPDHGIFSTSSGFDPVVDSFFIRNFGDYESPGGNCFGMAAYSSWYFHSKKSALSQQSLRTLYKEGDLGKEEDDQIARELITRAFQAGQQKTHLQALDDTSALSLTRELTDRFTAMEIIQQLFLTKQPQILALGISKLAGGWSDGHAVTVFAYDGVAKNFLYYDNNFPGETVTLPWSWENGFGTNSKNKDYDRYAFASFNSAYSPTKLNEIYSDAAAGFPISRFPKITVTQPTSAASSSNTFEVSNGSNIVLKGRVDRPTQEAPSNAQRYVHLYVNGATTSNAYAIDQTTNEFSVPIAQLPNPIGTDVMLLVSESQKSWAGGFHSFKQFKLRVANQSFFTNLGFEASNFSSWLSERFVWGGGQRVTPSDKSAVLGSGGFDPIATDIPTALFGSHSARVNNSDNDYHISTLAQSAVVPNASNPVIKFYWAAVMEDPNHDPSEQPYVEVSVVNQTKGITVFKKRFYSNDPSYSGWKSYQNGSWKAIPWQLVEIPVSQYVGDTITIKVEAADCSLGGHGGYAYLDAEE